MDHIVNVEIFIEGNSECVGNDEQGEYHRGTKTLHLDSVIWRVESSSALVGRKLTIKAKKVITGDPWVNTMTFERSEQGGKNCYFESL